MKLSHWMVTAIIVVVSLYLGKMFGSKLPNIPGIG